MNPQPMAGSTERYSLRTTIWLSAIFRGARPLQFQSDLVVECRYGRAFKRTWRCHDRSYYYKLGAMEIV